MTCRRSRAVFKVPMVPADEVRIVSDSDTCRVAGRKYRASPGLTGPAPEVHVVRVGPTRYIVENPDTRRGEFTMTVTFDVDFNEIAAYGG